MYNFLIKTSQFKDKNSHLLQFKTNLYVIYLSVFSQSMQLL